MADLVATEVRSTPLMDRIDDATYQRTLDDARAELDRFVTASGQVELPITGHLITATPA